MNALLEKTLAHNTTLNDALANKRKIALQTLNKTAWPTRKTEAWKYTSLRGLENFEYTNSSAVSESIFEEIDGLDCINLVFKDGVFQGNPNNLPQGLSILSLSQAINSGLDWALALFNSVKPNTHYFGLLNDVVATIGAVIDVAEGCQINQPIRIISISTQAGETHQRNLIRIGNSAKLSIIEQAIGRSNCFNTYFSEYEIGRDAALDYYRLNFQEDRMKTFCGSHFNLNERSILNSVLVAFGSDISRVDVDINHVEKGAQAKFDAIFLLKDKEHFDLHSTVEHKVPNGTTTERVRCIVAHEAVAVFNGRIQIHKDAQHTVAKLHNSNLLLSDTAEINTKPELEIYADDVICAHGATIAQIDEEAIYYLRSRGIPDAQANLMLNFGFINELIDDMPQKLLAEWLRALLKIRFELMNT